ncbi:mucin-19 isoform X5 [Uranotaenia lowii]|uniref:mucin-19 isoform X5 n=1 Tax=Uranotaenia lowii TaxID=190385 RepID=UPI002479951A|nr:mucin-19 isoform X5 [Uranotaenia lowii]
MSTLTHSSSNSSATSNANNNVNNNNNNNLIITSASPAAPSSTSVANSNTLNNNNNSSFNATPGTPVFPVAAVHSGLASSAKRLLPFTRNMSTTTAPASTSSGAAAAAGQQQLSNSVAPPSSGVSSMATVSNCPTTAAGIIPPELNVVLHGYHRKLKKNKKKYFVVYGDTPEKSARLEYFDSEKKFKQSWLKSSSGSQAKRSIVLRSCFNINKRNDTGKKHVIALYTKDDCFFIVFDSEEELNRWLRTLLSLQRGEDSEDDPPRPTFEHVWDVVVQRKGLGESYGIIGNYRLCITDKTLSLVRIGNATVSGDNRVEMVEFPLASLRRYGGAQRYLYLEVGRSTTTGAGEIWIQAQDNIIASNMLATIMKTAKNKEAADTLGPIQRNRSSSANAAYKPTQMPMRRSTHTGQKPINCSPSGGGAGGEDQSSPHASYAQSSESSSSATSTNTVVAVQQNPNCSPNSKRNSEKQSTTTTTSSPASASHSSSTASSVGGPPGNSSQSHSHSHHRIPHHPFPSSTVSCKNSIKKPKLDPPKEEESGSSYSYSTLLNPGQNSPSPGVVISLQVPPTPPAKLQPQKMAMAAHHHEPTNTAGDTSSSSPMSAISSDTVEICSPNDHGAVIARERCDSLPSRNRTSSETSTGGQQNANASGTMPPPKTIPSASFQRPLSMIVGGHHRVQSHSHSPPVHSSPLSPPSTGACSTCSDGSSLSIDETDYGGSGTTPEEGNLFPKVINPFQSGSGGSIPEENSEEYIHNYPQVHNYQSSQHQMLHQHQHRSIDEFSSHTMAAGRRGSPAPASASVNIVGSSDQTGGGSSTSNYMGMYSPGSSSPGDPSGNGGYIPMSPITDFPRGLYTGSSSAHSRASSLAEDTVDGYVPMAARAHNEEYVDMEPSHASSSSRTTSTTTATHPAGGASGMTGGGNGNISSAASSCSITSGTPSTDMRFSEYHLEKVVARFTPSEDDEMDRPLRTYSVGSRLEHNKRKLRVDMLSSEGASNSRARAFSVGSRAKVPRSELYKSGAAPITAPLLSTGSSGSIQESNSNSGSTVGINMMAAGASGISDSGCSKKSSSAPMLAPKQHGSVDHMEDLMEIDYGVPFHAESSTPQKGGGMEDYMIMTPGGVPDPNSGYVEMKPGHNAHSLNATNAVQEESDYLVMLPGMAPELNLSTKSTSSPIDISSPKKFNSSAGGLSKSNNNNNNYIDMSPRMNQGASHHTSSSSAAHRKSRVPSEDYLNITPLMMTSSGGCGGDSGNEDKMTHEDDELAAPSSAPEGYMEMSWNQNKSSLKPDSAKPAASDEYINMDFTRKEINRVDSRLSSQPIAIQQSSSGRNVPGDDAMEPKIGGAPSNIPNYLPLHSSAAGQQRGAPQIGFSPKQHGIRARCDSRDSGIVTPSGSQATIFPFSPGSPIKSFMVNSSSEASAEERKCFVDGTTGSLRISEIDEENSEESTEFLMMDPQQKPQTSSNDQESNKLEDLSHNYAELSIGQQQQQKPETSHTSSFSSSKRANLSLILTTSTNTRTTPTVTTMKSTVEYPNYVNCSPVTTPVTPKPQTPMTIDDQAGDYAIMNPASQRKLSSTSQSELSTVETAGLPPLTRKSYQIGFKPITSSQDEALLKKCAGASPKAAFHRQYSERRTGAATDASGYELLQRTSRPNSVNSEKISGSKCSTSAGSTRPNSANSDRLPIISATSSSASSTSTLCESKNHSPTASSTMIAATTGSSITTIPNNTASSSSTRPESVSSLTDPHIISRPPSVSSERELHYASLDLPPCSSSKMEVDCSSAQEQPSPAGPRSTGTSGGSDSLNSSPSPNSGCTSQQPTAGSAFTYAQIDFVRTFPQGAAATTTATQQPSAGTKSGGGQP